MIEEKATVVGFEGELVLVESLVKSGCSGCQQVKSCGSGQIAQAFPQKTTQFKVRSHLSLNVGDMVTIGLSEKILLSSAWQVYMWPLIGLILMSSVGQYLVVHEVLANELFALPIAVLGGYLGFYLAKKKQHKLTNEPQWLPVIIDKY